MIFTEILPCVPLRPFVDNFLLMNFDLKEAQQAIKPYPTRIEQALVFFVRGYIRAYDVHTKQFSSIAKNALFGQQVSRLDFHPYADDDFMMIMVVFRPGAFRQLLAVPSHELTCQFIDAESILASELRPVNEEIANAKDYPAMIGCLEQYLLKKYNAINVSRDPIDRIAQLLIDKPCDFSLDWLANQANLSPRQFQRRFNDRIGIGPKIYSRISRFSKALNFKEANPGIDWLTVSLHFGYSDYYHLAKDFKQFAHTTPNSMLQEYAQRLEMVLATSEKMREIESSALNLASRRIHNVLTAARSGKLTF
jgi:AraC-like DNA-binding protein